MRQGASWLEKAHTLLSFMIITGAFTGFYVTPALDANDAAEVGPISRFIWPSVVLPCLLFSWRRPQRILKNLFTTEPFLLALIALAMASTTWSLTPGVSLKNAVVLMTFFYYACYLAATYSWSEVVVLFRWALRLGLIMSCVAGVLVPNLAIHHGLLDGLWRGLFGHKNSFGRYAALLFTLSIASRFAGLRAAKRFLTFDVFLSVLVLFLSQSKTAMLEVVLTLLVTFLIQAWLSSSKSMRYVLATLSLSVACVLVALIYWGGGAIARLDHDRLLTGRVSLWKTVLYFGSQKPWKGYGYDAFFREEAFGKILQLWEGWRIPHAHNTVLELFISLGVFSVVLYLGSLALFVWRSARAQGRSKHLVWFVLAFNLLSGLSEISAFPRKEASALLFMFLTVSLARAQLPEAELPFKHSCSPQPVEDPNLENAPTPPETEGQ